MLGCVSFRGLGLCGGECRLQKVGIWNGYCDGGGVDGGNVNDDNGVDDDYYYSY